MHSLLIREYNFILGSNFGIKCKIHHAIFLFLRYKALTKLQSIICITIINEICLGFTYESTAMTKVKRPSFTPILEVDIVLSLTHTTLKQISFASLMIVGSMECTSSLNLVPQQN